MITSFDDYPVHQVAEPIRHAQTSDRNFYDRYYFNAFDRDGDQFIVMSFGQYPNLGVQDAFAVISRGDLHRVVRSSAELVDRADTTIGPLGIEVIEPLQRLRVRCDGADHGFALDLEWNATSVAHEEPRHHIRMHGRVVFDTYRFAQLGAWTGWVRVGDDEIEVTPDRWMGTRDRSWGVRPVGEPEPPGIRGDEGQMSGMWNYFPARFDEYSLVYMLNETERGDRTIEEAVRIWDDPDRGTEWLGRPEHEHVVTSGTRLIERGVVRFPDAPDGPLELVVTPMARCYLGVGTGYGLDEDWRHGMYQGPLAVQGLDFSNEEMGPLGQYVIVENSARFELNGDVGFGMMEHGFWGGYLPYGMEGATGLAP